ncbi:hypothetical protein A2U01_0006477 [Trifolium medium]|uniref:Uncharacterized protein n=1 Tax=Trifolium medium TaxID=97028 RepID=A0A392MF10_9FABA|nr:hypothetical protein [Trifolium medium]
MRTVTGKPCISPLNFKVWGDNWPGQIIHQGQELTRGKLGLRVLGLLGSEVGVFGGYGLGNFGLVSRIFASTSFAKPMAWEML